MRYDRMETIDGDAFEFTEMNERARKMRNPLILSQTWSANLLFSFGEVDLIEY